jgi:hypothetical protein
MLNMLSYNCIIAIVAVWFCGVVLNRYRPTNLVNSLALQEPY